MIGDTVRVIVEDGRTATALIGCSRRPLTRLYQTAEVGDLPHHRRPRHECHANSFIFESGPLTRNLPGECDDVHENADRSAASLAPHLAPAEE